MSMAAGERLRQVNPAPSVGIHKGPLERQITVWPESEGPEGSPSRRTGLSLCANKPSPGTPCFPWFWFCNNQPASGSDPSVLRGLSTDVPRGDRVLLPGSRYTSTSAFWGRSVISSRAALAHSPRWTPPGDPSLLVSGARLSESQCNPVPASGSARVPTVTFLPRDARHSAHSFKPRTSWGASLPQQTRVTYIARETLHAHRARDTCVPWVPSVSRQT